MRLLTAIAAILALSGAALGQIIGPERLIAQGGNGISHQEAVIAVNPFNDRDVTVGWQAYRRAINFAVIHYAVSLDGHNYTAPAPVPLPGVCTTPVGSFDPVIAVSRVSGDKWVGGLVHAEGSPVFVARKPAGQTSIAATHAAIPHCNLAPDKPWLAIGPHPNAAIPETMYATMRVSFISFTKCDDGAPLGTSWPQNPTQIMAPIQLGGLSTSSAVVHSGPQRGRLIIASSRIHQPQWTLSDNAGATWVNAGLIDEYGSGLPIRDLTPGSNRIVPPGMRATSFTSMAIDPTDPNLVYIIFAARDAGPANEHNVDLFVAISTNGGETFLSENVHRLTDAQIRLPTEPAVEADQLMPAIAIDGLGGINIAFVHTTAADNPPPGVETRATIRYARFPSRAHLSGTPFIADLTGAFRVSDDGLGIGINFNNYLMVAAAGCRVYIAYARAATALDPVPTNDLGSVYVRAIVVSDACQADTDGNGAVTSNDATEFFGAYAANSAEADVNLDGAVTLQDLADFTNAYSQHGP